MAIGKITGTMLQANLERQGINISIDSAAYFDVTNYRLGVNNNNPQYTLDITGNAHLGNLYILGNTITTDPGTKLNLGSISNIQISGGSANYVIYTDGAGNLTFGNLDTLSGVEGFTANYITLGSNTQGALVSNAASLTVTSTVTDSIALINQVLGNITNSTGSVIHVSGNITAGNISANGLDVYSNLNTLLANAVYQNTWLSNLNTNVTSTSSNVANLQANSVTLFFDVNSITANIGSFYTWANTNFGTTSYANANVAGYLPIYSGNISAGNITSKFYGNILADLISPYQTPVTIFNSTGAIGLPSGSNVQYPSSNIAGYLRYNNSISTIEFYNGTGWVGVTNSINDQTITPDGVSQSYSLNQSATANGILVSINGVVQRPGVAYTVSGTTITFTEVPLVTDIVDVRFIATAVSASLDYEVVDTGNITVNTGLAIVDSFSNTLYRSAKYTISSTNPYDSQFAEVMLVQNGASVVLNTIANVRTGTNAITYSANVNSGIVNFLAQGTTATNQLRIQRTYFNV